MNWLLNFIDFITFKSISKELNKVKQEANETLLKAQKLNVEVLSHKKYTTIKTIDTTTPDFKGYCSNLSEHEYFKFLLMILEDELTEPMFTSATNRHTANDIRNMVKGLKYLKTRLHQLGGQ